MALLLRADARALPLPDNSVDLVVTSPPYWALRSYTDGGEHYDGQIGSEPTPTGFLDNLIAVTRECMRVLKPTGSIWVNLGDKYSGAQGQTTGATSARHSTPDTWARTNPRNIGTPSKSLIGLPWRYAIRCVDELDLILRAEVIWSKPNGLPESVTDRVRRSHETWFHFTKQQRYFSAVDAIREPRTDKSAHAMSRRSRTDARLTSAGAGMTSTANPLGNLPGSVWEIATQPLNVPAELDADHFAAFPMEWPRRLISGWSPSGICTACGEGRRPATGRTIAPDSQGRIGVHSGDAIRAHRVARKMLDGATVRTILGEECACLAPDAPARPAVVLDPFGGTGTTALVADALGRCGVSVDRSADYLRIAAWRTTDPGQRAKALGVDRPAEPLAGQGELFSIGGPA